MVCVQKYFKIFQLQHLFCLQVISSKIYSLNLANIQSKFNHCPYSYEWVARSFLLFQLLRNSNMSSWLLD